MVVVVSVTSVVTVPVSIVPLCVHSITRFGITMVGLVAVQVRVKLSYRSESGHDVSRPRNESGEAEKLPIIGSIKNHYY